MFFRFFVSLCKVQELNKGENSNKAIKNKVEPAVPSSTNDGQTREGYLQWINRCIYTCHLCHKEFLGDMGLYNHVRAIHDKNFTSYKEKFGSSMSKKVVFDCPICNAHILHNLKHLTAHIKLHNNMKLFDFYAQYIATNTQPVSNVQQIVKSSFKDDYEVSEDFSQYANFDEWANATKYGCKICDQLECRNLVPLLSHLKKVHQTSKSKYISKHGSLIVKKVLHKCRLCSSLIQQSYNILYNHLNEVHQQNVHEYYSSYIQPSKSPNDAGDDKQDIKPIDALVKKDIDAMMKVEQVMDKSKDVVDSSEKSNGFHSWVNSCTFQCKICYSKTNIKSQLVLHVQQIHEMDAEAYKKQFGSGFQTKVYHTCGICQMKVLCCVEMLTLHLKAHGMSPFQYYETYIANTALVIYYGWIYSILLSIFCNFHLVNNSNMFKQVTIS